jgi:hypothetical protein
MVNSYARNQIKISAGGRFEFTVKLRGEVNVLIPSAIIKERERERERERVEHTINTSVVCILIKKYPNVK